ncbi:pectin lyase A [Apiospora aurea]|uniref:Pectin lyase A n=1 Tax=Apiospora aurea TaxID=335848 RepID=A0ABR1PVC0_9PEZI
MSTRARDLSDELDGKINAGHVENEVGAGTAVPLKDADPKSFTDTYRSCTPEFARETERGLVRKIDSRLMPFVVIIYLFNYLDRNSITQARLYGLQEDIHVKGAMYQTAISIFSAGYIFMKLPGTIMMSIFHVGYFIIPDYPGTTKWLSEEEKVAAQGRLAADAGNEDGTGEDEVTIWQGIAWALKDHRVWLFACLQMATTASISYSHFFPTLIQQIGFKNSTTVLLLTAPLYLFSFFWAIGLCIRRGQAAEAITACNRLWSRGHGSDSVPHSTGRAEMGAICADLLRLCRHVRGLLHDIHMDVFDHRSAAAIGIANTCANVASLFASYFWLDKYEPYFRESWACLLAFQALGMACILTLRYTMKRRNRRFEMLATQVDPSDAAAMCRLTEEEQRAVANGYRYII